jgi:hypothetical protein
MRDKFKILLSRIRDRRSRKVVFLSHCILNENTRYLGGASRESCVSEILKACIENHIGIVQMPCPEQRAWGGVTKKLLLMAYESKGTLLNSCRRFVIPLILAYTSLVYWWMARDTAGQIQDYLASGFSVAGVVGIDGSPTCGVNQTLDFYKSFDLLAHMRIDSVTTTDANRVILECLVDGMGLFSKALRKQLKKRRINVPYVAHDLTVELEGKTSNVMYYKNFFCEIQNTLKAYPDGDSLSGSDFRNKLIAD